MPPLGTGLLGAPPGLLPPPAENKGHGDMELDNHSDEVRR